MTCGPTRAEQVSDRVTAFEASGAVLGQWPRGRAITSLARSPDFRIRATAGRCSRRALGDRAFKAVERRSGRGRGTVVRIRPDDAPAAGTSVRTSLDSGTTVLVVHAIDVAGRVLPLQVGNELSFRGEYVWNARGGLVHWTHHDPAGRHAAGWIRRGDRTWQ